MQKDVFCRDYILHLIEQSLDPFQLSVEITQNTIYWTTVLLEFAC